MASRMDEFRTFLSSHPGIQQDVESGNHTWQQMYEDWVILGEENPKWQAYRQAQENSNTTQKTASTGKPGTIEELLSSTSLKNVINYVKKIDPDSISKTLNTVQKVLQITQSFGGRPTGIYNQNYNSWWD